MNNQYYSMYPYYNTIPNMRSAIYPYPTNFSGGARSGGLLSSLFGTRNAGTAAAGIGASATKSFSFSNLLNGASKTLGVINQAIPVVYQVKPIWNNAKTMFRVAKEMAKSDTKPSTSDKSINISNNSVSKNINNNISNNNFNNNGEPKFFV